MRCDAIAKGLINVVETMNLRIPIIARLQGTNMEAAQKLINESGLKIFSIDDLQSAAEKSVQFSKVVKMGESGSVYQRYAGWSVLTDKCSQHAISTSASSSRWASKRVHCFARTKARWVSEGQGVHVYS